jgi:hypothetical protein
LVYINRTTKSSLHRQGEEPTVKEAYTITAPTYLGTIQQNTNIHAAAQVNPNQETSDNVI